MTNISALSLKETAIGDLNGEIDTTRRMLERVPEEHFTWKPHEKSWSLGALAMHLANLFHEPIAVLQRDEFDPIAMPSDSIPESRDELLDTFDKNASTLKDALDQTDEAALSRTWQFKSGEQVIFSMPKIDALRTIGISHMIHHRGQLSVYLRLLDVPVPSSYGPTADEKSTS